MKNFINTLKRRLLNGISNAYTQSDTLMEERFMSQIIHLLYYPLNAFNNYHFQTKSKEGHARFLYPNPT